jgi:hypothetical protein
VTFVGYLRYHPLITTWLVILVLVIIASVPVRLRRRPARPYTYGVPWGPAAAATAALEPLPMAAALQPAPAAPVTTGPRREPVKAPPRPVQVPVAAAATSGVLWRPFAQFAKQAEVQAAITELPADQAALSPVDGKAEAGAGRLRSSRKQRKGAGAELTLAAQEAVRAEPPSREEQLEPVAVSPQPELPSRIEKSPPNQFWNWLAAGSWAGEEARVGKVADQEAPA